MQSNILDGGAGYDVVRFHEIGSPVIINLATGVHGGGAAGDTLIDIEEIRGGGGDDIFIGDGAANVIHGHSGDDQISGGGGGDRLVGSDGDDLILGESGDDRLYGLADNDTILGGEGRDLIRGGDGNDLIEGGLGHDQLKGEAGADIFRFGADLLPDWASHSDTIADFETGQGGDALDFSDLLDAVGYVGNDPVVDGYIRIKQNGDDTKVQFDQDGFGGESPATIVVLYDVQATDFDLTANLIVEQPAV